MAGRWDWKVIVAAGAALGIGGFALAGADDSPPPAVAPVQLETTDDGVSTSVAPVEAVPGPVAPPPVFSADDSPEPEPLSAEPDAAPVPVDDDSADDVAPPAPAPVFDDDLDDSADDDGFDDAGDD